MNRLKRMMEDIKYRLKLEYKSTINEYWKNKIENIPSKDPKNMFPQINQIFRPKGK
jgi:hypothetical protein